MLSLLNIIRVIEKSKQYFIRRHKNGVVHGDIKPSNLFLQYDGRAVIGDFGSARVVKEGEELVGIHIK